MAVMAKWRDKTWEVSSKRVAALNGISASVKLDTENSDDKAGSPSTRVKALELQSFTFDYDLAASAGADVRGEYEAWTRDIAKTGTFFLGGRRFGPKKLQLTGVSLSDTLLSNDGQLLKGKISITLTEYAEEASGKKPQSSEAENVFQSSSSGGTGERLTAVNIGASSAEKAEKKPKNFNLNLRAKRTTGE